MDVYDVYVHKTICCVNRKEKKKDLQSQIVFKLLHIIENFWDSLHTLNRKK